MGNCMERCTHYPPQVDGKQQQQEEQGKAGGFVEKNGFGKGGIRVKVILTKEELEWLMFALKDKGGKSLEDILAEIERGREKVEGWKPSLESIKESPEVLEMDR
ncbi:hypothetical protein L1049_022891 [Liquidambar formosana]|uniref:Uncharacterized protein n=1 Tax=Liquidambar formosana TaxID=63359 RepID=A0AAP0RDQ0_LIQFO